MKIEVNDQMLQDVTNDIVAKIDELLGKEVDPLAIAGVLMAQALQMYKTMLPEGDYKQLAEELPNMAEQANKWEIDNATKLH
jgi:DNA polymerase III delta subunit